MEPTLVAEARRRLAADVHRTPLLSSRALGEIAGGRVFLKAENLQRSGAFKIRGALNAVRMLSDHDRRRGVTTYSSGNHGQALALAARIEGARAVVFVPEDAAPGKVAAARGYGAEVRFAGTTSADRQAACEEAVAKEGLCLIPPFDDARVIAGQGTVALEILDQAAELGIRVEDVLVPVGGGGLVAGVALVLASRGIRVHPVEPDSADKLRQALAAGRPVRTAPSTSIADGLRPLQIGDLNFALLNGRVAAAQTVTDDELRSAMRFLLERCKLLVEPSGAAPVAALLAGRVPLQGRTAVAILSGGNAVLP